MTTVMLALGVAWLASRDSARTDNDLLTRADRVLYDWSISRIPLRDAPITLVLIDNTSIGQIGRWPWPRALHAEGVKRIAALQPRAIALDLLLTEPSGDDALLAAAIRAGNASTVLAASAESAPDQLTWPMLPVQELANVALLGHAQVRVDSDGLIRGLYLNEAGMPALALALARAGGSLDLPDVAARALRSASEANRDQALRDGLWPRQYPIGVPFGEDRMTRVSYAQLLRGEVAPEAIRDRYVLVGVTALGLTDAYATPAIGTTGFVHGVDLHARALNALLTGQLISEVAAPMRALIAGSLVWLGMLGIYRTRARTASLWLLLMLLLSVAGSLWLLARWHLWLGPAAAIVGLLLAYPIWSWRRLSRAVRALESQAQAIEAEAPQALVSVPPRSARDERLLRGLQAVARSSRRLQATQRFLSSTLNNLTHPVLVTDPQGSLRFANQAAHRAFVSSPLALGQSLWRQLDDLLANPLFADHAAPHAVESREVVDRQGRFWLVTVTRDDAQAPDWLVQFVDVTAERLAQREREQALRFLSHDLRTPQVSVLNLIDVERLRGNRLPVFDTLERHAKRTLALADSFVQLSRADLQQLNPELFDLSNLAVEAADAMHALASAKSIRIHVQPVSADDDSYDAYADVSLVRRALTNLIHNAIKYSPTGTQIDLRCARDDAGVSIEVADQGVGIDEHQLAHLFEPYWQAPQHAGQASADGAAGVGLGLAFVRVAIERQGGRVSVVSSPGQGSRFTITLPRRASSDRR